VIEHRKNRLSVEISDNGIGLPKDLDVESLQTLGLKLVRNLIEGQLGGRVDFASSGGTRVTMRFAMEGREGAGNGGGGA
jgi:two-component sensor histidine kinase